MLQWNDNTRVLIEMSISCIFNLFTQQMQYQNCTATQRLRGRPMTCHSKSCFMFVLGRSIWILWLATIRRISIASVYVFHTSHSSSSKASSSFAACVWCSYSWALYYLSAGLVKGRVPRVAWHLGILINICNMWFSRAAGERAVRPMLLNISAACQG